MSLTRRHALHARRAAAYLPGTSIYAAGATRLIIVNELRRPDGLLVRVAPGAMR